ncbi:MAG: hypothetical protein LC126_01565 [Bryobacterales bacterium]|nr:hypothetical protein [Bryobacterales bacterium]
MSAIVVAAATLAIGLWPRSHPFPGKPPNTRSAPLTAYLGREMSPSFSPDGNRVAFAWDGEGRDNLDIYTLTIGAAWPFRLTKDSAREYGPAWSPDGKWIAYLRDLEVGYSAVMLAASDGRSMREVHRIHSPPTGYWSNSVCGRALAWSRNGKYLVVPDREAPEEPDALYAVAVANGSARRITQPSPDGRGLASPAFSPDGRWLAFAGGVVIDTATQVWVAPVSDDVILQGTPRNVPVASDWIDSFDWAADGKDLLISAAPALDASRNLYRVPVFHTGSPTPVPGSAPDSLQPSISRGGSRLIYSHQDFRSASVSRIRVTGTGQTAGRAERLVTSTSRNMGADISPDGEFIAYRSLRSGVPAVWMSRIGDLKTRRMSPSGAPGAGYPAWSGDGKWIAMQVSGNSGSLDIYLTSVDGEHHRWLTGDGARNQFPTWSRDGKWIYYSSIRTGRFQIWKMPADGGTAVQVTRDGGSCLKESADGKRYFVGVGVRTPILVGMPAGGGKTQVVVGPIASPCSYVVASTGIYFLPPRRPDGTSEPRFYDLATGAVHAVMTSTRPVDTGLSLSSDETMLVFTQIDQDESTLILMDGFR